MHIKLFFNLITSIYNILTCGQKVLPDKPQLANSLQKRPIFFKKAETLEFLGSFEH